MKNGETVLNELTADQAFGAGGWVTDLEAAEDGGLMGRTDTYNAYFRAPGSDTFVPELRAGINLDPALLNRSYPDGLGSYAIGICRKDSTKRYILTMGYLYRTLNNGVLWTRTSLPYQPNTNANDDVGASNNQRMWGSPVRVDPNNALHVVVSTKNGNYFTFDGGDTWTTISTGSVPVTAIKSCIAFDPTATITSGRSQRYGIFINGSGLYITENAGTSFTKMADAPLNATGCRDLQFGPNGWIYLIGSYEGHASPATIRVRRTDTNVWVTAQGDGSNKEAVSIAFDPLVADRVWSLWASGGIDRSDDKGLTFSLGGNNGAIASFNTTQIPWQGFAQDKDYFGASKLAIDSTGRMYSSGGVGVYELTSKPTGAIGYSTPCTWTVIAKGVENTVLCQTRFAPDGNFGAAKMDRGIALWAAGDLGRKFPATYGVDNFFQFAQGVDYAPEDTRFWVGASQNGKHLGYTPNLGKDWIRDDSLKTLTDGQGGGQVVALAKDIWLAIQLSVSSGTTGYGADVAPKNRLFIKFKGNAWTAVTIGNNNAIYGALAYYLSRRTLIKDEFVPYRAWFYNTANVQQPDSADHLASVGCYRIDVDPVTGAVTVARRSTSLITQSNWDDYNGHLTQIGVDSFLWHAATVDTPARGLYLSTDGMQTWPEVTGTDDQGFGDRWGRVYAHGSGLGPGNTRNGTLYVVGFRQNGSGGAIADETRYGHWKSVDGGATWQLISRFPLGIYDVVLDLAGHPLRTDCYVIGTAGHGLHQIASEQSFRGV